MNKNDNLRVKNIKMDSRRIFLTTSMPTERIIDP